MDLRLKGPTGTGGPVVVASFLTSTSESRGTSVFSAGVVWLLVEGDWQGTSKKNAYFFNKRILMNQSWQGVQGRLWVSSNSG